MPDVFDFQKRLPTWTNLKLPQTKFSLPRTRYVFLSILAFFALWARGYVNFSDYESILLQDHNYFSWRFPRIVTQKESKNDK